MELLPVVAKLKVPYILMHMKGLPENMQHNPTYENLMDEIILFFRNKIAACRALGIHDIILDPGFGFGKSLEQNYELLGKIDSLKIFNLPILAGISRKSMVCKVLKSNPDKALNGTTVLNTIALLNGVKILRVHDVREAKEAIQLIQYYTVNG